VEYCLREAGLTIGDVDYVTFYEKPVRKFERLLETYVSFAPSGFKSFAMAMPVWLKEKLRQSSLIRKDVGKGFKGSLVFTDHHESHAASAFFPSPFDEAAILTLDGVGEWTTTAMGVGQGNKITITREIPFPHFARAALLRVHVLLRLQGEQRRVQTDGPGALRATDLPRSHHPAPHRSQDDGSLWMDMRYFNYCQGLTMTSPAFHDLFGGEPRRPESAIEQRHMDLAASIQAVHRGGHARDGRGSVPADGHAPPGAGRRRRTQLCGQRPAASRGTIR
jgi:carbamoyltransferase